MMCHAFSVLMWPKPSGIWRCAPLGSAGPSPTMPAGWRRAWTGCRPSTRRAWCWKPPAAWSARCPGLGHGRPSRGRRAPAAGPRCCPRHGPAGHNGGVGCPGPRPLCRRDPPDAAAAPRRPDAGAARPPGAPPATDRHADRGAAPPGGDERAPHAGYGGPYDVAHCGDRHAGRRPRDAAPGQPAVAGHDDLWPSAKGLGPVWARTLRLALPALGTLTRQQSAACGRRGAPPWRPWDPPRSAHDLGRARACAHRVSHGHAGGHTLQPADQRV